MTSKQTPMRLFICLSILCASLIACERESFQPQPNIQPEDPSSIDGMHTVSAIFTLDNATQDTLIYLTDGDSTIVIREAKSGNVIDGQNTIIYDFGFKQGIYSLYHEQSTVGQPAVDSVFMFIDHISYPVDRAHLLGAPLVCYTQDAESTFLFADGIYKNQANNIEFQYNRPNIMQTAVLGEVDRINTAPNTVSSFNFSGEVGRTYDVYIQDQNSDQSANRVFFTFIDDSEERPRFYATKMSTGIANQKPAVSFNQTANETYHIVLSTSNLPELENADIKWAIFERPLLQNEANDTIL